MSAASKGGGWVSTTPRKMGDLSRLSVNAELLWHKARIWSAGAGTDGRVPLRDIHAVMDRKISAAAARKAADELVEYDEASLDGDTLVLDWSEQPTAAEWNDPVLLERRRVRKALYRDRELLAQIRSRDRNLCRYCGVRVDWQVRNGGLGGTMDHIDPDGGNAFDNVAVSCRRCNGRKRDRTPQQAGMPLLKPGTTADQAREVSAPPEHPPPRFDPGSNPDQSRSNPRDRNPSRARARPDRVNPGSNPDQSTSPPDQGGPSRARTQTADESRHDR